MRWADGLRCRDLGWRCYVTVPVLFFLVSFLLVFFQSYLHSLMLSLDLRISPLLSVYETPKSRERHLAGCDIYSGSWMLDESYPMYETCSFVERGYRCRKNGRPDREYEKWRWQPNDCNTRFNALDMLRRLKGSRVVFVGDSMGRTQWQSLVCLLLQAVENKASVTLINGPITKTAPFFKARFTEHNLSIDYYRSPFLVEGGRDVPPRSPKRVRSTLKLERMGQGAKKWQNADLLVINTGHWWTSQKTRDVGCYFEVRKKLMLGMNPDVAFQTALKTITSWVNDHIDANKTEVYFRTFEPAHWEMSRSTQPLNISQATREQLLRAGYLKQAVEQMTKPATLLNITSLSAFRPDGHVFNWTGSPILDCAHWCLPGVPDTWNELLYSSLIARGKGIWA